MGRACSTNGESRGAYRALVVKPGEIRPLRKPRRIRKDNIKMDLKDLG
jgi:hypothetical protein